MYYNQAALYGGWEVEKPLSASESAYLYSAFIATHDPAYAEIPRANVEQCFAIGRELDNAIATGQPLQINTARQYAKDYKAQMVASGTMTKYQVQTCINFARSTARMGAYGSPEREKYNASLRAHRKELIALRRSKGELARVAMNNPNIPYLGWGSSLEDPYTASWAKYLMPTVRPRKKRGPLTAAEAAKRNEAILAGIQRRNDLDVANATYRASLRTPAGTRPGPGAAAVADAISTIVRNAIETANPPPQNAPPAPLPPAPTSLAALASVPAQAAQAAAAAAARVAAAQAAQAAVEAAQPPMV